MQLLFINTHYKMGGAAIAADRLVEGLRRQNVNCRWFTKHSVEERSDVSIFRRKFRDRLLSRIFRHRLTCGSNILSTKSLRNEKWWDEIDVLHFHNLHGDYFNFSALPVLTKNKPAVWTLHDMWSFTGHCAYSKSCQRWQTGCGQCPDLTEYPGIRSDWTRWEWKIKRKAVSRSRLHIVTPSRWLANAAKESFLGQHPVSVIPYGLDTNLYAPLKKNEARIQLGLKSDVFTILLASVDLYDPRKPQRILCEALNRFTSQLDKSIQVITFGNGSLRQFLNHGIPLKEFGLIDDDVKKATLFSAADAFLFVSVADNLPLVIQESMSCGTPVIANPVGGVPEMVIHGETGLLTDSANSESFDQMLMHAYSDRVMLRTLAGNARSFCVERFNLIARANDYKEIYETICAEATD